MTIISNTDNYSSYMYIPTTIDSLYREVSLVCFTHLSISQSVLTGRYGNHARCFTTLTPWIIMELNREAMAHTVSSL